MPSTNASDIGERETRHKNIMFTSMKAGDKDWIFSEQLETGNGGHATRWRENGVYGMMSTVLFEIVYLRINKAVAHEIAFEIAHTIEQETVMPPETAPMCRKTTGVTGDSAAPINNVA